LYTVVGKNRTPFLSKSLPKKKEFEPSETPPPPKRRSLISAKQEVVIYSVFHSLSTTVIKILKKEIPSESAIQYYSDFSSHESRFGGENSSRPQQDCAPCPEFRRSAAVVPRGGQAADSHEHRQTALL
jgi:hypothetical protein